MCGASRGKVRKSFSGLFKFKFTLVKSKLSHSATRRRPLLAEACQQRRNKFALAGRLVEGLKKKSRAGAVEARPADATAQGRFFISRLQLTFLRQPLQQVLVDISIITRSLGRANQPTNERMNERTNERKDGRTNKRTLQQASH